MEATRSKHAGGEQVAGLGRRLAYGVAAGVVAAVANAVIYLVASPLGAMPQDVVANGQPVTLGAVVTSSFVPALLAAVLFALLGRFTIMHVVAAAVIVGVLTVLGRR